MDDEQTPVPFVGCRIPHEVISVKLHTLSEKIETILSLTNKHSQTLYGNGFPGLTTHFHTMNDTLKTLAKDIQTRKQNSSVLVLTLAATIVGNLITAVLVYMTAK